MTDEERLRILRGLQNVGSTHHIRETLALELNLRPEDVRLEVVGVFRILIRIDFSAHGWKECNRVYNLAAEIMLQIVPRGIGFFIILDHEDWRGQHGEQQ